MEDLLGMRKTPLAVFCSDVHFSERPSSARSEESDWFEVMRRPWLVMGEYALLHKIPIIIAGDVFDHWKPSPRLINFAMTVFEGLAVFAIPGQHDLPDHNYDERYRSGYGTLEQAKIITNIEGTIDFYRGRDKGLRVYGFPWGKEIVPLKDKSEDFFHAAVIHKFIWKDGHTYVGASQDTWIGSYKNTLRGYDIAVFGDNHSGFTAKPKDPNLPIILNCGGLIPRRRDEIQYQPRFGVYFDDGTLSLVDLPTSGNKWSIEVQQTPNETQNTEQFIEKLTSLSSDSLDFRELVKRCIDSSDLSEGVKLALIAALDHCSK